MSPSCVVRLANHAFRFCVVQSPIVARIRVLTNVSVSFAERSDWQQRSSCCQARARSADRNVRVGAHANGRVSALAARKPSRMSV